MQGATGIVLKMRSNKSVSIHAPYAGSDLSGLRFGEFAALFQSTPPMQGATTVTVLFLCITIVSIHAPYAGSDVLFKVPVYLGLDVSIHAPYAGSDEESDT